MLQVKVVFVVNYVDSFTVSDVYAVISVVNDVGLERVVAANYLIRH